MPLRPLTQEDFDYIKSNYQSVPVKDMALHLRRANKTIYDYLEENELTPFRLQAPRRGNRNYNGEMKRFFKVGKKNLITGF